MFKNKKGSLLAYSLLILAIMFAIIGSISAVSVLEKKSAISSNDSMQAFQVADNGVQRSLKQINNAMKGAGGLSGASYISAVFATNGFSCSDGTGTAIVKNEIESDKPYSLNFYRDDTEASKITSCNVAISEIKSIKSIGNFKTAVRAVNVKVGVDDPCAGLTAPIVDPSGNKYGFVAGTDKRCWLDRNLGAASYPTAITGPTDPNGYGWYFQWGRGVDGHQIYSPTPSSVITGPVATSTPGSSFVKTSTGTEIWYNGSSPSPDSLWSGVSNAYGANNNPCPTGWHIPTGGEGGELDKYMKSTGWNNPNCSSDCINKIFNVKNYSNSGPGLQLTAAGFRRYGTALNDTAGIIGLYWTSNFVTGTNASMLNFGNSFVNPLTFGSPRGTGAPVRCIRNQ